MHHDTEHELAEAVARLRRAMRRAARSADPNHALSVAQLELLSAVGEHPGIRPGQLAKQLHLAPNSVTTLVNGLHAAALITRSRNPDDRRTVELNLTPGGVAAVRRWHLTNAQILRSAFETLHPAWQQVITGALPALRELTGTIDTLVDTGIRTDTTRPLRPSVTPAERRPSRLGQRSGRLNGYHAGAARN